MAVHRRLQVRQCLDMHPGHPEFAGFHRDGGRELPGGGVVRLDSRRLRHVFKGPGQILPAALDAGQFQREIGIVIGVSVEHLEVRRGARRVASREGRLGEHAVRPRVGGARRGVGLQPLHRGSVGCGIALQRATQPELQEIGMRGVLGEERLEPLVGDLHRTVLHAGLGADLLHHLGEGRFRQHAPRAQVLLRVRMEAAHELGAIDGQHVGERLRLVGALAVAIEQREDRLTTPLLLDELHHPRALRVGLRAIVLLLRPHERQVDRIQVEEPVGFVRLRQELHRFPGARLGLQVRGNRLREPVRDAVARLLERHRVHVLVAKHLLPVEGAQVQRRRTLARCLERDERSGAGGNGVDPRHAGDAHREALVVGVQLDHRGPPRHVAEPRGDVGVHVVERLRHPRGQRLVDAGLAANHEVLAFVALPVGQHLDERQAVPRALVEGIERHGLAQRGQGLGIAPGLHLHESQFGHRCAPSGRALRCLAERRGGFGVLAGKRQEPAGLVVAERGARHQCVELGQTLRHGVHVEAHAVGGGAQRQRLPLRGETRQQRIERGRG